jgi:hypothetical protein
MIKKTPDIFISRKEELNREHLIDGNGDIIFGMIRLKPDVYIKVLSGNLYFRVNGLSLFDEP